IGRTDNVIPVPLRRPITHPVLPDPLPILRSARLELRPILNFVLDFLFFLLHRDTSIPRSFSSVKRSTFLCIPASFARFTALLRKSAEKSACEYRSRSDTGVARYSSRGAKAWWAAAGSPFQGQTS